MTMSLLEKISPHLVVGLEGETLSPAERAAISGNPPAGLILFERNVSESAQLAELSSDAAGLIEGISGLRPLLMADHEGGRISVLARAIGHPPPQGVARVGEDLEYYIAALIETARRMLACGVNMVLGPVADINSEIYNPVIGTRAFPGTATDVADAVRRSVSALHETGILTCIKHFPGHGSTRDDSHLTLPILRKTLSQLEKEEIEPFREGIAAGADAVMTAHIAPAGRELPFSLDPEAIGSLLRGGLGFDGVVITDALEMGGAAGFPRAERFPYFGCPAVAAACGALSAGNDLLLFSRPILEVYGEISKAEDRDAKALSALEEAVAKSGEESIIRIGKLRKAAAVPPSPSAAQEFSDDRYLEAARRSVTVERDPSRLLPLSTAPIPPPLFCGERRDFEYYTVRRFIFRLLNNLEERGDGRFRPGRHLPDPPISGDPAGGHIRAENLEALLETSPPAGGGKIELVGFDPVAEGGGGTPVLVLLGRRGISAAALEVVSSRFSVVVTAGWPPAAGLLPAGKTVINCRGIYDAAADIIALLLAGSAH